MNLLSKVGVMMLQSWFTLAIEPTELFKVKDADCRSCNDKNNFYGIGFLSFADLSFG